MTKKKNWIKVFACGAVIMGGLTAANAHSTYRTFNIQPFKKGTTSSYTKTDSSIDTGINLDQAKPGEVRDTINFTVTRNGTTQYSVDVVEGNKYDDKYSTTSGSDIKVTYRDTKYNLGAHKVVGTFTY